MVARMRETVKSRIGVLSHTRARDTASQHFRQYVKGINITATHKMLWFLRCGAADNYRCIAKSLKTLMYAKNRI
jgi:hypothetical protein